MSNVIFYVVVSITLCGQAAVVLSKAISNDVTRPGFSPACRGANSITKMVAKSDVVLEAGVGAVSPPRNNIYAVTLKVQRILKDNGEYKSETGQKLQLLFIKPEKRSRRPELRSLGTAKSYLEACIYEMDLKVSKIIPP